MSGTGLLYRWQDDLVYQISSSLRLRASDPIRWATPTNYRPKGDGKTMMDLNSSHQFSKVIDGTFQVQNLTDVYQNEYRADYAALGRQSKVGLRIRW